MKSTSTVPLGFGAEDKGDRVETTHIISRRVLHAQIECATTKSCASRLKGTLSRTGNVSENFGELDDEDSDYDDDVKWWLRKARKARSNNPKICADVAPL